MVSRRRPPSSSSSSTTLGSPATCTLQKRLRDRAVTVSLGTLCAVSSVGLTLMSSWLNTGAPDGLVRPFASSIWLAVLSVFFAVDTIVTVWHGRKPWLCCTARGEPWLYGILLTVEALAVLCYGLAQRWDAVAWGLVLCVILGVTLAAVRADAADKRAETVSRWGGVSAYTRINDSSKSVDDDFGFATLDGRESEQGGRGRCRCTALCVGRGIRGVLRAFAVFLTVLLLGGAIFEAQGYTRYTPEGKFVTITHASGLSQTILTQCVTPTGYVPGTHPTFWSEVGGGGHSMSDLWGLRDELVNTYRVRYCSYDMPGTGWSESSAKLMFYDGEQVSLTEHVMEALGETGPYVIMGSMDNAFDRALNFALFHQDEIAAVVPVTMLVDEFQVWRDFYNKSNDDMIDYATATLNARAFLGNLITFFPINWGIAYFFITPSPTYVPHDKAEESAFLNVQNEKQWTTNVAAILQQLEEPDLGLTQPLYFGANAKDLNKSIPILNFNLGRNASQLDADCKAQMLDLNSDACRLYKYTYEQTIAYNEKIVALNPDKNRLILCQDECADTSNAFLINQGPHIKWFAKQLMDALNISAVSSPDGTQNDNMEIDVE